jgi:4-hydroxythreonine-4-phosphate dehydrogenase
LNNKFEDEDEYDKLKGAAMRRKPLIGITLGDPSGIGPEVVLRALADRRARAAARFMVFGSEAILERVASEFHLPMPKWEAVGTFDLKIHGCKGPLLWNVRAVEARLALLGRPTERGGAFSVTWIAMAVGAAMGKGLDAIVTAPISKEAIAPYGPHWPGHTEMLATLTRTRKPVMMMVAKDLRIALVTTHAAIKDLPGLITRKNVLETIRIVDHGLKRRFGLRKPRIGVCGLNPHAGEAGLFGAEEKKSIAPAIRQAQREGIACDGPIPADAAFTPKLRARHDAFVAMFHDQACIPVKMLAFDSGVNVTLGLPIIRTSPDHGTAYDIVRKGVANPGSMVAAILLASQMAKRLTTKTPRHQELCPISKPRKTLKTRKRP